MKKIVLVCGLIAGFITSVWTILSVNFLGKGVSLNVRLFLGYASMVLAFSLIYAGVKSYRDNQNGGLISFGKSLQISLLITLIASTVYVTVWMIDFYFFIPDFSQHYMNATRAKMVAQGASTAQIKKAMADMAKAFQQYKNPVYNALMTYKEILPMGISISLIASLILKRKVKPVAANTL